MENPRRPADFYETAKIAMRIMEGEEPPSVAELDQMTAAYAESIAAMTAAANDPTIPVADNGAPQLEGAHFIAWGLALHAAMEARASIYCAHWADPAPRPLLVELTDGFATCPQCGPPPEATVCDDGHCDICDAKVEEFWAFMGVIGNVTYWGNICDECHAWAHTSGDNPPE